MNLRQAGNRGAEQASTIRSTTVQSLLLGVMGLVLAVSALTLLGCAEMGAQGSVDAKEPTPEPESEVLRERIDNALLFTYRHRHLNLADHAAWQILHGVLTYKQDFMVRHTADGEEEVAAVEHIFGGGEMKGWTVRAGDIFTDAGGRRGLVAELEAGSNTGQGHYDQWLAVLAQCDLPPDEEIRVGNHVYTMEDFVSQVMWDVPDRRLPEGQYEFSWTLIGLSKYLPSDHTWKARDGEEWSIERLVQIEAELAAEDLSLGACGGTHRLIGLTMAYNQHLDQGGEVEGPWLLAEEVIDNAVMTIQGLQNNNGTFSVNWLERPGVSLAVADRLGSTGHQLEFLTLALNEEELQQPWVKRAVASLCDLFDETRTVPLECGALYHASHGLALYRERIYGPLAWTEVDSVEVEESDVEETEAEDDDEAESGPPAPQFEEATEPAGPAV